MEYKIYTLSDPETLNVRYVGVTSHSLSNRLSGHIHDAKTKFSHKCNWIKSLLAKGLKPLIQELESCTESEWEDLEIYWIEQFRQWNFHLVNADKGGKGVIKIN